MATLKARIARFEAGLVRNDDNSEDIQRAAPLIERLEARIEASAAAGFPYGEPTCEEVAALRQALAEAGR